VAYLICIAKGTLREGINKLDDIVDVVDSYNADVYKDFRIVKVEGKANDIKAELQAKRPKVETVMRWQDPKTLEWYRIEKEPKYILTVADVDDKAISTEKLAAIKDNITSDEEYKKDKVAITATSATAEG